jgi:PAS domain S-box-containing protein
VLPKCINKYLKVENLSKSNQALEKRISKLESELAALRAAVSDHAPDTVQRDSDRDHSGVHESAGTFNGKKIHKPESTSLRKFIEYNAIGVVHATDDGRFMEANDRFTDMIGYSHEEIQSQSVRWDEITPPEYAARDKRAVDQLKATGKADPFEKEYIHKSGRRVPVLLAISSVGSDCLAFIMDLTLQKQAEEALKTSEAQFRQLSNMVPQLIWIADAQRKATYANDRFYEYTGLTREQHDGTRWKKIIHPDDHDRFTDDWRRSAIFPNAYEIEVRYRRKDGVYRWHIARALPVTNAKNEVLMWFGTSTDIDDQKHAEEDLKESEMRFRTLADAIPQIVWTAEPDGTIDFFNHRWFEYTGLTAEQSLDGGWSLLIHPDDRAKYMTEWQRALAEGDTYETEFRLKRAVGVGSARDNPFRWHLGRAVALHGEDGTVQKWFATWTEIENQMRNR